MQCELCGKEIKGKAHYVKIEGSELNVCDRCVQYGQEIDKWAPVSRKVTPTKRMIKTRKQKRDIFDKITDEIVSDYNIIIREAREKHGLTQDELALKIKEKASLIKKIERCEIIPEDRVIKKLERALDIKLTEKVNYSSLQG
ncbi:MAG: multiprotein bridging factor aMBF1 [Methanosarcinales archaeon]|nr:TIGR00270 family protein [Methanosarcinales archaeon]